MLLIVLEFILFSCDNTSNRKTSSDSKQDTVSTSPHDPVNETYNPDIKKLTKDFMTWYNYTYYNVSLTLDFVGLNEAADTIGKKEFLRRLKGGDAIAFKVAKWNDLPVYQLYKLNSDLPKEIGSTMIRLAEIATDLYEKEGKVLPEYHFTDLNGRLYDKENTLGKILVMKCWFISCVPCVKEFPELNKLVDKYKDRKDILFVSLAFDSAKALNEFLQKKPFRYAVVPDMEGYMRDKLKVITYPTHFLINRKGKIVKVTNTIGDMLPSLEKEAGL